jgi:hypothetical protein
LRLSDTTTATLYTSDTLYVKDSDDLIDSVSDAFRHVYLLFSSVLSKRQVDPWFYETEWDSFYKLYATIKSTTAFNVVLKSQHINA